MTEFYEYARKAFVAGALSALGIVFAWNITGWIDGTETFDWRSVLGALVGGFIVGVRTYFVTNTPETLNIIVTRDKEDI